MSEQTAAQALFGDSSKPTAPAAKGVASVASALFGGTMKPAQEGEQPKPSEPQAKPVEQQKPVEAKTEQKPEQTPEATPQAVEAIANAVAEHGFDAADPDTQSFAKLAGEIGISPEHATKLAAWDQERSNTHWAKQVDTWTEATNSEFLISDIESAREVVRQHGDAELQELLNGPMGIGAHPALVRFVVSIARKRATR